MSNICDTIYKIVAHFTLESWRPFARSKLDIKQIKDFEEQFPNDFREMQYRCVEKWQREKNIDDESVCKELWRLNHEFCCQTVDFGVKNIPQSSSLSPSDDIRNTSSGDMPVQVDVGNNQQIGFSECSADGQLPYANNNQQKRNGIDVYPLDGKRGRVLIISNSFQREEKYTREPACKIDVENMKTLWQDSLNCELFMGEPQVDIPAIEMNNLLYKMSKLDKKDLAYVVVVIMTHGGRIKHPNDKVMVEVVYGNDKNYLEKRNIESMFRNDNALKLQGVPKFFIYQSCRGEHHMVATTPTDPNASQEKVLMSNIPDICDILVIHSSHPKYSSYRSTNKDGSGSWLIEAIYEVFKRHAKNHHVVDMLTMVNAEISKMNGSLALNQTSLLNVKSMSIFESSLIKRFYLLENEGEE